MPHLVIYYTPQLDDEIDMSALCRLLANTMQTIRDEAGQQVFPTGGTRVLAYPAQHFAVADDGSASKAAGGNGDYAFMYLNVRMGRGRSEAAQQRAGETLAQVVKDRFAELFAKRHIGITLQVDVGAEVFDAKHSNIHPLFAKK